MSIRTRLGIAFCVLVAALLAIGVGSVFVFLTTERLVDDFTAESIAESELRDAVYARVARADEAATDAYYGNRAGEATFRRLAEEVARRLDTPADLDEAEEAELAARAERSWRQATLAAEALFGAQPARQAALARFRRHVTATYAALSALGRSTSEEAEADVAALTDRQHGAAAILVAVLLVSVAVAIVAARIFLRFMAGRVGQLEEAAARVGRDDLDVRLPESADELGQVARSFNAMAQNISATRAQLTHQAFHDSLTGLANRALFLDRVGHALDRGRRAPQPLAVVYFDLDDFKSVNDGLGHAAGDNMLRAAARRLELNLRPADTLARLGGDEFAVLLEDVDDAIEAARVTQRLLDALAEPSGAGSDEYVITASAGIVMSSGDEDADVLLRNADLAMYSAKRAGRGAYAIFEPQMHVAALERLQYEAELRRAIENQEFSLRFQPVVDLEDGSVLAVETLVRWEHPERGEIQPNAFIPVAERTGLIVPLGRWILWEACAAAARLQAGREGESPLGVGVNLSPRQFTDSDIVADVAHALRDSGLDPATLTLEITESVLVDDLDVTVDKLEQLRALGVRLALDDFGTGYASLSYLQRLPLDVLKIDRTFISQSRDGDAVDSLTSEIVEIGKKLGLSTLAEGIESKEQLASLREAGCELGQGFLFAHPLPEDEVRQALRRLRDLSTA